MDRTVKLKRKIRPPQFRCKFCGLDYALRKDWRRHLSNIHGRQGFTCDVCTEVFYKQNDLDDHILSVHKGSTRHVCKICNSSFKQGRVLAHHMEFKHKIEDSIFCKKCDEEFHNTVAYKKHVDFQHGPGYVYYKCNQCVRSFRYKKHVNLHKNFDHSANGKKILRLYLKKIKLDRKFLADDLTKCTKCKISFKYSLDMIQHLKSYHQAKKAFTCCKCQTVYSTRSSLGIHQRHDHGMINHSCEICPAARKPSVAAPLKTKDESQKSKELGQFKNDSKEKEIKKQRRTTASKNEVTGPQNKIYGSRAPWTKRIIRENIPDNLETTDEKGLHNLRLNIKTVFNVLSTVVPSRLRASVMPMKDSIKPRLLGRQFNALSLMYPSAHPLSHLPALTLQRNHNACSTDLSIVEDENSNLVDSADDIDTATIDQDVTVNDTNIDKENTEIVDSQLNLSSGQPDRTHWKKRKLDSCLSGLGDHLTSNLESLTSKSDKKILGKDKTSFTTLEKAREISIVTQIAENQELAIPRHSSNEENILNDDFSKQFKSPVTEADPRPIVPANMPISPKSTKNRKIYQINTLDTKNNDIYLNTRPKSLLSSGLIEKKHILALPKCVKVLSDPLVECENTSNEINRFEFNEKQLLGPGVSFGDLKSNEAMTMQGNNTKCSEISPAAAENKLERKRKSSRQSKSSLLEADSIYKKELSSQGAKHSKSLKKTPNSKDKVYLKSISSPELLSESPINVLPLESSRIQISISDSLAVTTNCRDLIGNNIAMEETSKLPVIRSDKDLPETSDTDYKHISGILASEKTSPVKQKHDSAKSKQKEFECEEPKESVTKVKGNKSSKHTKYSKAIKISKDKSPRNSPADKKVSRKKYSKDLVILESKAQHAKEISLLEFPRKKAEIISDPRQEKSVVTNKLKSPKSVDVIEDNVKKNMKIESKAQHVKEISPQKFPQKKSKTISDLNQEVSVVTNKETSTEKSVTSNQDNVKKNSKLESKAQHVKELSIIESPRKKTKTNSNQEQEEFFVTNKETSPTEKSVTSNEDNVKKNLKLESKAQHVKELSTIESPRKKTKTNSNQEQEESVITNKEISPTKKYVTGKEHNVKKILKLESKEKHIKEVILLESSRKKNKTISDPRQEESVVTTKETSATKKSVTGNVDNVNKNLKLEFNAQHLKEISSIESTQKETKTISNQRQEESVVTNKESSPRKKSGTGNADSVKKIFNLESKVQHLKEISLLESPRKKIKRISDANKETSPTKKSVTVNEDNVKKKFKSLAEGIRNKVSTVLKPNRQIPALENTVEKMSQAEIIDSPKMLLRKVKKVLEETKPNYNSLTQMNDLISGKAANDFIKSPTAIVILNPKIVNGDQEIESIDSRESTENLPTNKECKLTTTLQNNSNSKKTTTVSHPESETFTDKPSANVKEDLIITLNKKAGPFQNDMVKVNKKSVISNTPSPTSLPVLSSKGTNELSSNTERVSQKLGDGVFETSKNVIEELPHKSNDLGLKCEESVTEIAAFLSSFETSASQPKNSIADKNNRRITDSLKKKLESFNKESFVKTSVADVENLLSLANDAPNSKVQQNMPQENCESEPVNVDTSLAKSFPGLKNISQNEDKQMEVINSVREKLQSIESPVMLRKDRKMSSPTNKSQDMQSNKVLSSPLISSPVKNTGIISKPVIKLPQNVICVSPNTFRFRAAEELGIHGGPTEKRYTPIRIKLKNIKVTPFKMPTNILKEVSTSIDPRNEDVETIIEPEQNKPAPLKSSPEHQEKQSLNMDEINRNQNASNKPQLILSRIDNVLTNADELKRLGISYTPPKTDKIQENVNEVPIEQAILNNQSEQNYETLREYEHLAENIRAGTPVPMHLYTPTAESPKPKIQVNSQSNLEIVQVRLDETQKEEISVFMEIDNCVEIETSDPCQSDESIPQPTLNITREYNCNFCRITFPDELAILDHLTEVHAYSNDSNPLSSPGRSVFKCIICSIAFRQRNLLDQHVAEVHKPTSTFKCNICSAEYLHNDYLINHEKEIHGVSANSTFQEAFLKQMNISPRKQVTFTDIPANVEGISGDSDKKLLECVSCNMIFENEKFLDAHNRAKHTKKQFYKCLTCNVEFTNKKEYSKHRCAQKSQSKSRPSNIQFDINGQLDQKIQKHNVGSFKCDYCDKYFIKHHNLLKHCKQKHFDNSQYVSLEQSRNSSKKLKRRRKIKDDIYEDLKIINQASLYNYPEDEDLTESSPPQVTKISNIIKPIIIPQDSTAANIENKAKPNTSAKLIYKCDNGKNVFKPKLLKYENAPRRLHKCLKCTQKFPQKAILLKHIKNAHNLMPNKLHRCQHCCAVFKFEDKLSQHYKLKHSLDISKDSNDSKNFIIEKPVAVAEENPKAADNKSVSPNIVITPEMLRAAMSGFFGCTECGALFLSKESLQQHVQVTHSQNMFVKCGECGVVLQISDLRKHMLLVHYIDSEDATKYDLN